jgi:hypothetical protein
MTSILVGGMKCRTHFWKGITKGMKYSKYPKICQAVPPSDQDGCTTVLSLT